MRGPARDVVQMLKEKGGRSDVIKLVSAYETALYGIPHMQVANAYESRRQAALAEVDSTKLKAAAAASAIALVQTKLAPGESTDGAVFFEADGKALRPRQTGGPHQHGYIRVWSGVAQATCGTIGQRGSEVDQSHLGFAPYSRRSSQ